MNPVPILIAAHVFSMLGFAPFAALLPQLRDAWSLSNAQAGVVGGMFFVGYVASVSYWTALTDRGDGRKVYATGSLLAAVGSAGFGWLARGFGSALFFQALLGGGIAGTYMPGLRLLSDRISGPTQSRPISYYTASFSIGTAFSLAMAGAVAPRRGVLACHGRRGRDARGVEGGVPDRRGGAARRRRSGHGADRTRAARRRFH